jgi:hypothetical protein
MIDALDECDSDILQLLKWIARDNSEFSCRVKWLTTSRNEPYLKGLLELGGQLHTSLELNSSHVSHAVNTFIGCKIKELARLKKYSNERQAFVTTYLLDKTEGTFLWVALVCKELEKTQTRKTEARLQKFPAGLEPLYDRMMEQVQHMDGEEDADLCRHILCSVSLTFRPLHLRELSVFSLPEESCDMQSLEDLEGLVGLCGSFLAVRQETVYFVHQSAKDYFTICKGLSIFPSGQPHEHSTFARQCLKLMSDTLKRDVWFATGRSSCK